MIGTLPVTSSDAKVPLQLIMAKTRHKNLRTAMRYIKPGGEAVAEITGILGPSRRKHLELSQPAPSTSVQVSGYFVEFTASATRTPA
jgi:hypothetical protein